MVAGLWATPWVRVPLVAVAAVVLQVTVVSPLRLLDVSPDIVVTLGVVAGLVGGSMAGAVIGFLLGLVYDLALTTPFGLWALTLCGAAYVVGFAKRDSLRENLPLQAALAALAAGTAVVFYAVAGTVFGAQGFVTFRLVAIALLVAGTTALLYRPARAVLRWALRVDEPRR
jgi:rod shape-determining protein MreD